MASSAPSSPVVDATPLDTAPPMGGSASTAVADGTVPSAATTASPSAPVDSSAATSRDEVALTKARAEAAATVASASAAAKAATDEPSAGEEEDDKQASNNKGAASNPTHNWVCSGVEEGELNSMASDGVLPLASATTPT